jgi:RNA polymerase sigma-70 factor, ECF subfamily
MPLPDLSMASIMQQRIGPGRWDLTGTGRIRYTKCLMHKRSHGGKDRERSPTLDVTRQSLLMRAVDGDQSAWGDILTLYRPLIVGCLHRQAVAESEVADLVQEIFLAVYRGLPSFQHGGRQGSFRAWLRAIARNHSCEYWRSPARRSRSTGNDKAEEALRQLEDPASSLWRFWDDEHDRHVVRCLLEMMEIEFEPATMKAFRRMALEGASGAEAAGELGLSVGAVYTARSRVLNRLREVAGGLIDDTI